jgi:isoleucyl-tRNA synthetase
MMKSVPGTVNFPDVETRVLHRWEEERTFEQSVQRRLESPTYVFYDGPPFATGLPHYGHILTSYIKDIVPRYFTMRGFRVPRRWGWDCHGLPVEFEVEKDLGFGSKKEILDFGIGAFNEACRNLVLRYANDWREVVVRMGRWVDFDGAYKTMDLSYMESVLWAFKRLHERGLVTEGSKIVPYCVRCQTVLSNFEARLDDAFRPRKDASIYVKFRREGMDNEYFLAWTTTPWTLPSNVALAVSPSLEYSLVDFEGDKIWVASDAVGRLLGLLTQKATIAQTARGDALVGVRYAPLFPYFADVPNAFRVVPADFVDPAEGTGIVHVAPSYGEEDFALGAQFGLPAPAPVKDDGTFDVSVGPLVGLNVFDAAPMIRDDLAARNLLLFETHVEHAYPHCWRCDHALIYRAVDSWFIKASTMRDDLVRNNDRVTWIPSHIKEGRFGDWIRNARDWAVSRSRFWGSPIPAWRCEQCGQTDIIGSIAELERRSGQPVVDLHRPAIDEHMLECGKCSGRMRRVPDVFDCWFESGAMPFASQHYPFDNERQFEENFPANFIVEYLAQTRGWFYTLFVLSTGCLDSEPFRSAMCHGVIQAADGRKMSKRLKNYPDPKDLMNEHGSDALRIALLASPVAKGANIRFSAASVRDAVRRFHILLWNCIHFFTSFASIDGFAPAPGDLPKPANELDRYLLHEIEELRGDVEALMESYDFARIYARIERFINILSTWYIRLNKPRIWREGLDDDKRRCYVVVYVMLDRFARIAAPFMPFVSEALYEALGKDGSVHLQDWPEAAPQWLDCALAEEMGVLRTIVSLARNVREMNAVSLRIPLRRVRVAGVEPSVLKRNATFLQEELNVKAIEPLSRIDDLTEEQVMLRFDKLGKRLSHALKAVTTAVKGGQFVIENGAMIAAGQRIEQDEYERRLAVRHGLKNVSLENDVVVALDLALDDKLILEGAARELNRHLQDLRKKARLKYTDRVEVSLSGGPLTARILESYRTWLMMQVLATRMSTDLVGKLSAEEEFDLDGERVRIGLRLSPAEAITDVE